MLTEAKITKIFCIANNFYKVFDAQMAKYTVKSCSIRKYHHDYTRFSKFVELSLHMSYFIIG